MGLHSEIGCVMHMYNLYIHSDVFKASVLWVIAVEQLFSSKPDTWGCIQQSGLL